MRIIGGRLRGRRLANPGNQTIRPTTDRNRESLFNILTHSYARQLEGTVLDTFAGTGALGFEAVSRGASQCLFMENNARAAAVIKDTIASFGLSDVARVIRRDATKPGQVVEPGPFDLVFADPPYGKGLGEQAAAALAAGGWLTSNTIIVLEESSKSRLRMPEEFRPLDMRRHGETSIAIFQYEAAR